MPALLGGPHRATLTASIWSRVLPPRARASTPTCIGAQLVYAAKGTMQSPTPKGPLAGAAGPRGLGPRKAQHSIDGCRHRDANAVFRSGWLQARAAQRELRCRIRRQGVAMLHQTILALFDGRNDPDRNRASGEARRAELHPPEDSTTFHSAAARSARRAPPTSCSAIPPVATRSRRWRARRDFGADACRGYFPRRRN